MTKKFQQLFKEHGKTFIKLAARKWDVHLIGTLHATTGCQLFIYVKYFKTNPNKGDQLLAICRAIHETPIDVEFRKLERSESYKNKYEETIEFLEEVWDEYRERITARAEKGGFKFTEYEVGLRRPTRVLNELLLRGFLLYTEVTNLAEIKYVIKITFNINSHPATVFWNKGFNDKKEARRIARRFAVGDYKITRK